MYIHIFKKKIWNKITLLTLGTLINWDILSLKIKIKSKVEINVSLYSSKGENKTL